MIIGLDFDEVTAELMSHFHEHHYEKTGEVYSIDQYKTYNMWEVWGVSKEESVKMMNNFHNSYPIEKIKPLPKAIESINKLMKENKLVIITARPVEYNHKISAWIKLHFPNNKLNIINSGDFGNKNSPSKLEIINKIGATIMIEDSSHNALECAQSGINVILFDKPWNQGTYHKNISRVHNWSEALKEVENWLENQ